MQRRHNFSLLISCLRLFSLVFSSLVLSSLLFFPVITSSLLFSSLLFSSLLFSSLLFSPPHPSLIQVRVVVSDESYCLVRTAWRSQGNTKPGTRSELVAHRDINLFDSSFSPPKLSHLISSHLIITHRIGSHLILCHHIVLPHFVSSHLISSYPISTISFPLLFSSSLLYSDLYLILSFSFFLFYFSYLLHTASLV